MSRPHVVVSPVAVEDLVAIAEFKMDAYDIGAEIQDHIFPPERRPPRAERIVNAVKRLEYDLNAGIKVMVKATLEDTGEVVGYAQWMPPGVPIRGSDGKLGEEKEREIKERAEKEGIDWEFAEKFQEEMTRKREGLMGDRPHWYLIILTVAPSHQKKGIGKALMDWGTAKADEGDPPIDMFLESSVMGRGLYEKVGFEVVDWCELELASEKTLRWPSMRRKAKAKSGI